MKIVILTYGSRGDVQPFIPLSLGLMARGHVVRLAAPTRFKSLVEESGIQFVPLAGDPEHLSRRLNDAGHNFVRMVRELMDHAVGIGADVLRQVEDACSDADLIIHTFMHVVGAHTLAREKNIPDIHVQLFPMFTPTGDYPNVTLPDLKFRFLNRWTHQLSQKLAVWSSRMGFEQVRRRAGLARRKLYSPFDYDALRPSTPILCAWSPGILPTSNDWPDHVHATGYYFSASDNFNDYQPPGALQQFLQDGPPPICVSFGSMIHRDAQQIQAIVAKALMMTNHRAVVLSGWNTVDGSSSNKIFQAESVPHQWLLPRCKMLIHHGGAGTTSAGLRAGIPNIVIPFTGDQPFWGRRVNAVGAGPRPIPVNYLSVENLIHAIMYAGHDAVCQRAHEVSHMLGQEDGVIASIQLIEQHSNERFRKYI